MLSSCGQDGEYQRDTDNVFSDKTLQEIYDAANQNDIEALNYYATHEVAAYRMAYARCMGSVQDSSALENLYTLMSDPIPYVRLFASFAVGQYSDTTSLRALEKALKKATIPEIKAEVLEAIGKSADANALEYLIFHEPSTAIEESGKMWGIYNASLRGLLKEEHLRIVAAHLSSREIETQQAALQTLQRQRNFDLTPYRESIESIALEHKNPELRTLATMAMRHIRDADDKLLKLASQDNDPRVRAAAILSITDGHSKAFQNLIAQSLEDGSAWVAMNAANRLSSQWGTSYLKNLEQVAITSAVPEVKSAILTAFLSNDSLNQEGLHLWKRIVFKNDVEKSVLLKSLGYLPHMLDTLLHYSLQDAPLGTAATEGIIITAKKFPEHQPIFYQQAKLAFEKKLPAQSFLYANALREPIFLNEKHIPLKEMEDVVAHFNTAQTIETYNEIKKSIAAIKNEDFTPVAPVAKQIDWSLVEHISTSASAKIYVGNKTLTLKLLIEDAPATVANFVHLANSKFYDGTYFHRIVPVFVTQGGGPRGDGFGATDYTIGSEFSPLKFGAGVAGMASAGKDTESCQFFFTHISTPHLNGRYTIFGALTGDLSPLSEITTGSKIDSVRVEYEIETGF